MISWCSWHTKILTVKDHSLEFQSSSWRQAASQDVQFKYRKDKRKAFSLRVFSGSWASLTDIQWYTMIHQDSWCTGFSYWSDCKWNTEATIEIQHILKYSEIWNMLKMVEICVTYVDIFEVRSCHRRLFEPWTQRPGHCGNDEERHAEHLWRAKGHIQCPGHRPKHQCWQLYCRHVWPDVFRTIRSIRRILPALQPLWAVCETSSTSRSSRCEASKSPKCRASCRQCDYGKSQTSRLCLAGLHKRQTAQHRSEHCTGRDGGLSGQTWASGQSTCHGGAFQCSPQGWSTNGYWFLDATIWEQVAWGPRTEGFAVSTRPGCGAERGCQSLGTCYRIAFKRSCWRRLWHSIAVSGEGSFQAVRPPRHCTLPDGCGQPRWGSGTTCRPWFVDP